MSGTGDWQLVHDRYYRRRHVYKMGWQLNIDLSRDSLHHLCAAEASGPLAFVNLTSANSSEISIYTSSGSVMSSFSWQHTNLLKIGWSKNLSLICVLKDARVFVFSVHGDLINQFVIGKEASVHGIRDCCIVDDCIVAMTESTHELVLFHDFVNPIRIGIAQPDLRRSEPPTAMLMAIDRTANEDDVTAPNVSVIIATHSGSIVHCDQHKAEDQLLTQGPFRLLALSPDGQQLACFDNRDTLHCVTRDFKRKIFEFGTNTTSQPLDLTWCTNDAVIITYEHHLLLVGDLGYSFLYFPYSMPACVFRETDGVRVITSAVTEFIEQVPKSTESIFTIGSVSPAAMLYDAAEALEKRISNADDTLRSLMADADAMETAINMCLHAAEREFEPRLQKRLLKAASVGKLCYNSMMNVKAIEDQDDRTVKGSPVIDPDRFVNVCTTLRALNAVRALSIPITFAQLEELTANALIDRLNNDHQHSVSLALCTLLHLDCSRVLLHWATLKVNMHSSASSPEATAEEERALANEIVKKLKAFPDIKLSPIASAAYRAHRPTLALTVCEHETRAHLQVPLLISMNEEERALDKAIESGDTDLVHLCLLHLRRSRSSSALYSILRSRPLAQSLLICYARHAQELDLLKNTLFGLQKTRMAAITAIEQAYRHPQLPERIQGLQIAAQFFHQDRSDPFMACATLDQIKLLQVQRSLSTADASVVDLSVSDTIDHLLVTKQIAQAAKIQSMFKVPAKRFWHIQVQVYARTGQWAALLALVKGKKAPPIGYVPFIEHCIAHNNMDEAVVYVGFLPDIAERMEWLCHMGRWGDAAKLAISAHDAESLITISNNCNDPVVKDMTDKALLRLAP
uniref:Vacuolar protein sorting-associated protein 16 homolog n=1 Tax=Spongospora subterranea TaxID=70186 RepID=A0A0H5R595_9EUKA|eukprot:CRZ03309.1 hypothetical protein [Spongospora subterranea]